MKQIALTSLSPGSTAPKEQPSGLGAQYVSNAYHVSQGKKWYVAFNCNGCHANGGGDSGPPLMDDKWIYGGKIENIVQTIREGRPNGMPSLRGKLPDEQIWELAAYVLSMSGNVAPDVAPGRNDDLHRPSRPRIRLPPQPPVKRRQRPEIGRDAAQSMLAWQLVDRRRRTRGRRASPRLFWSFAGLCALIWVLVLIATAIAVFRRHAPARRPDRACRRAVERRVNWIVGSLALAHRRHRCRPDRDQLRGAAAHLSGSPIPRSRSEVTGHQWWWEVRYDDPDAVEAGGDRQRDPHAGRRAGPPVARPRPT